MNESGGGRIAFGVREAIAVLVMVSGAVTTFTTVQVQLQSADRRLTSLEASSVPRSEQEAREAERRRRELEWSQRLDRIEGKLDAVLLGRRR